MGTRCLMLFGVLLIAACDNYTPPPSWTLRGDCRIRASQRNEDYSIDQWIAMVKHGEKKDFGILLTPAGAASVTNELKSCKIELDACKQGK